MSEKREIPLVLKTPQIDKAIFVDFKTNREEWNKYKLTDDTLIRAKMVFSGFAMEENLDEVAKKVKPDQKLKIGLAFRSTTLFAVESPQKLRGSSDSKRYSVEELRTSIVDKEIDFETRKAVWNSYTLENGINVKVRISPISISRTSKFDNFGMPTYLVDFGADIKMSLPEHIQKILRKRKTKTKKSKTRA